MTEMLDLITKLSNEIKPQKPFKKPRNWIFGLFLVLVCYAVILQKMLGVRSDILVQINRPLFLLEVVLMMLLLVTSLVAAVLTMYPDSYQKSRWLKLPYLIFCFVLGVLVWQFFRPVDLQMVMPEIANHTMECTRCILLIALIPAAFIFSILQKGATTLPQKAGVFTVLSASSLGYLVLRFQEANDSISHLMIWHYFPMIFFAAIGAVIGKRFLKW